MLGEPAYLQQPSNVTYLTTKKASEKCEKSKTGKANEATRLATRCIVQKFGTSSKKLGGFLVTRSFRGKIRSKQGDGGWDGIDRWIRGSGHDELGGSVPVPSCSSSLSSSSRNSRCSFFGLNPATERRLRPLAEVATRYSWEKEGKGEERPKGGCASHLLEMFAL